MKYKRKEINILNTENCSAYLEKMQKDVFTGRLMRKYQLYESELKQHE